jgi:hypothetical protein
MDGGISKKENGIRRIVRLARIRESRIHDSERFIEARVTIVTPKA